MVAPVTSKANDTAANIGQPTATSDPLVATPTTHAPEGMGKRPDDPTVSAAFARRDAARAKGVLQQPDKPATKPAAKGKGKGKPATKPAVEGKFAGIEGVCAVCGKPIHTDKGIGHTCQLHAGKVGKYYKPFPADAILASRSPSGQAHKAPAQAQFVPLTQLCDLAQQLGRSRGFAVKLTGGDAGTQPPVEQPKGQASPYQIYLTAQGRKYVQVAALKAMMAAVKGK